MSAFVVSNDRSDGTPNVPDANASGKWRAHLWRRNREAGQGTSTSIYVWDEAVTTADPLYLKWVPIGNFITTTDLLSLQAASTKISITSSGGNVYFDAVESAFTIANISGDLPLSKLPATVPLLDAANTFSLHNTFSSGLTGALTGNASTASALATPRSITLTGDATGSVSGVDWSADVTINTNVTHQAVGSASPYWNASHLMSRVIGNQTPVDGDVYAWDQANQIWAPTPTSPTALGNLVDVTVLSPADGQFIKYVSSSSDWENFSPTTSDITEGTNLYYTDTRARLAVSASSPITYNNSTGGIGWSGTTTDVPEGTNLYFTNARVDSAGAVMESDFDATTFLYATSDNTPQPKTPSEVRTILNVEDGSTADQTDAEIRAAVEAANDSNVFTDADHTKLNAISGTNTGDEVAATTTIAGIVELATNTETTTGTDTSRAVTPAGVQAAVDSILDGAPVALDTLNELAAAIDDDASYASTITTALGLKAPIASPTFTGTVAIPNISDLEAAVTANTAKVTNVTTNLSVSRDGTKLDVVSSDGTNAVLPLADTNNWGVMSDEMFDEHTVNNAKTGITSSQASAIVANTAKVTNVTTDLSVTANGTSLSVHSSDGTDASIPAVTTSAWGAMTDEDKTKLDGVATGATANDTDANLKARANHTGTQTAATISDFDTEVANNSAVTANTAKVTNVTTDLSVSRDGTKLDVVSSDGTNAVLPLADTNNWGVMSDEMFDEHTVNNAKVGITSSQASAIVANTAKVTNATHTGDVTGSAALTIANNAVSLAKMAGLARGSIIIGDSSGDPAALAIGNNNYVLTSDGTDISWAAGGGGSGGHAIKDESGTALTARSNLDFIGELVAAVDNSGDDSTDITIDAKTAWLYG